MSHNGRAVYGSVVGAVRDVFDAHPTIRRSQITLLVGQRCPGTSHHVLSRALRRMEQRGEVYLSHGFSADGGRTKRTTWVKQDYAVASDLVEKLSGAVCHVYGVRHSMLCRGDLRGGLVTEARKVFCYILHDHGLSGVEIGEVTRKASCSVSRWVASIRAGLVFNAHLQRRVGLILTIAHGKDCSRCEGTGRVEEDSKYIRRFVDHQTHTVDGIFDVLVCGHRLIAKTNHRMEVVNSVRRACYACGEESET